MSLFRLDVDSDYHKRELNKIRLHKYRSLILKFLKQYLQGFT